MKKTLLHFVSICLCAMALCLIASAQDQRAVTTADQYLISAKAGGVNFVEGPVGVVRKHGKNGQLLKGDVLDVGDRVSTGADGKAEILLNPGSFLRLGGNSAFEFKTTSLDDLRLRLDSGSAILEVFAADEFQVSVSTPKAKYLLLEPGVYRVDVLDSGRARLEVWKGSATAGKSEETVDPGRVATTTASGDVTIAKFDRDEKDALDIWSKMRGKELAKLTAKLKRNDLRTSLMRSFLGRGWNMYSSFGLWVWDPYSSGYCFLPFGRGWYSPYGYTYGNYIGWYKLPAPVWYPPPPSNGGNSGGPRTPTGPIGPIVAPEPRGAVPPFVRMQQSMGGGGLGGDRGGRDRDSGGSSSDSAPSYTPSSSPPPSAPPPPSPGTFGTGKGDVAPQKP